ncbi:hypothetical protein GCM10011360_12800 [Primorskyibacter flagellatus]|uniref:Lysozyme inhibitor n=1 Tax=Primorskyibacter flagellatus TaxID=1387277 RepID=A0A917EF21_9RHOB|nr:hypothetical protein [Primorskyibacter flagellatus]GGE25826.1 hypothetical protein GCM10011360_12800 [Primorskyibacter flagellatus]
MRVLLMSLLALPLPLPALASDYSCNFSKECYEDEACAASDFTVEVRSGEDKMVTDFGTFPILAKRDEPDVLTVFVHSEGAVYLLSAGPRAARFTAHVTQGPQSITYLGLCEKVG